jgi:membrane protein
MRAKDRSPPSLARFVMRMVQDFERLEPFDRAMTLAAQAFTSIFPLVIAALSLVPQPDAGRLRNLVAQWLSLPPSTRSLLEEALPELQQQSAGFGLLGLLIVLVSATSFSRALTRMYARAWSVPGPGWRNPWRWIAAIVAIAASTLALQALWYVAEDSGSQLAAVALFVFLVNTVLWTWVPSILLVKQIAWILLLPGGLIMGVASLALHLANQVYVPSALAYASVRFGDLGVAFTYIGWLFAVAFVLITATVVGRVLAQEPGPLARWLAARSPAMPTAEGAAAGVSSGASDAGPEQPVQADPQP